jgi:outer membrane protein assembly factor BamB
VERWRYRADGPVRFAPALWEEKVYFVADDGWLRCLSLDDGRLLWSFRGGPSDRRVLGNERLVSMWPARGAPVVADGLVHFGAGIWPFMGVFLHALDARSGKPVWTADGDGPSYQLQPHMTESFAGVAPQGYFAVAGDKLLVPGGRSIPAVYERATGRLVHYRIAENGRRGGFDVAAAGPVVLAGGGAVDLDTGWGLGDLARPFVVDGDTIHYPGKSRDLLSVRLPPVKHSEFKTSKSPVPVRRASWTLPKPSSAETPRVEAVLKAGSRLYVAGEKKVVAVGGGWQAELDGTPVSMVAADSRLFVSTREGKVHCFGPDPAEPRVLRPAPAVAPEPYPRAQALLDASGVREGWAVVGSGPLAAGLAFQSGLRVIAVEPDPARALALRGELLRAGLTCDRVAVHAGDPALLPPYLAGLVAFEAAAPAALLEHLLRPHGGVACEPSGGTGGVAALPPRGGLPGEGEWTHEHADASNTRVSKDRRVRAPLGLLWFGGPSHEGILPRHGHGPQPQVLDGRCFIEGVDLLRATDIYTGRLLWEAKLPGIGKLYNNTAHQPGANAAGTNFITQRDGIWVALGRTLVRLDPATGRKLSEWTLPDAPLLGYLNVADDWVIVGSEPLKEEKLSAVKPAAGKNDDDDDPLLGKILSSKGDVDDGSSSRRLFVLDRKTGAVLWSASAGAGFRHNGVCAGGGRLYAIDRLSGPQLQRLKKKGQTSSHVPAIAAWDLATGRELWRSTADVFGTWLSYSVERDLLVEAGRVARDTLYDEPKGMRCREAATGRELWHRKDYLGPAMIRRDEILMADRGCDLRTGAPKARVHPVTGEPAAWTWSRNYGCNTPSAAEHLMTFRSGAAGFFDLAGDGGTGNFGGFRSSCTNNLIVAGGLIVAPDYTRTCTCAYQNQCSIALVPMPSNEMWTFFGGATDLKGPVRRVGLNLGAPGDRRAPDGTLWIEVPASSGKSPAVAVKIEPENAAAFRRHSSRFAGEGHPWVSASGLKGLRSLRVRLGGGERSVAVRLHFAEPEGLAPGQRVFDVALDGRTVLHGFDPAREAGGSERGVVREFRDVRVKDELAVSFLRRTGEPLLCGVEILSPSRLPLFRTAFERWTPDLYELEVRGTPGLKERGILLELRRAGANLRILEIPSAAPASAVLRYPEETGIAAPIWEGPLEAAAKLIESPARREIARRLLEGETAVWVLLESGDRAKDDVAAERLETLLERHGRDLRLPDRLEEAADRPLLESPPLRLAFSTLRIVRAEEELLARMLLGSEADLAGRTEPMAFAVYGRGRMLPALVGPGIDPNTVGAWAELLAGPTASPSKESTSGNDLLLAADWSRGGVPKVDPAPEDPDAPVFPPGGSLGGDILDALSRAARWVAVVSSAVLVVLLGIRHSRRKGHAAP